MAISSLLGIAQRALLASETALGVVGNNIANVNTPGYTRQVPDLESDPSSATAQGVLVGTGVHVAAVRQVLDPLLEKRLIGAETERRQQGAVRDQLSALASVLNELDQPPLGDATGAGRVDGGAVVHPIALREQGAGLDGQALHEAGLADGTGGFIAAPAAFASGELAALAGVRDGDLVAASSDLDTFASTLIGE